MGNKKAGEHTQGEWKVSLNNSVLCENVRYGNYIIAECKDLHLPSTEREANAKLIASAPKLKEENKKLREKIVELENFKSTLFTLLHGYQVRMGYVKEKP